MVAAAFPSTFVYIRGQSLSAVADARRGPVLARRSRVK
jgi:hypothetical protein